MESTKEKLLESLALKIVSLRAAKFSFLCCIKMQMEIYWQVFFHPGVKDCWQPETVGPCAKTCWGHFSLWVSCSDQQSEVALKFSSRSHDSTQPLELLLTATQQGRMENKLAAGHFECCPKWFCCPETAGLDSRPEHRPSECRFGLKIKLPQWSPLFLILNACLEQCFLTDTSGYFCDPAPGRNSPTQFLLASDWQVWLILTHREILLGHGQLQEFLSSRLKPRHCSGFVLFPCKFLQFWQHRAVSPVPGKLVESHSQLS